MSRRKTKMEHLAYLTGIFADLFKQIEYRNHTNNSVGQLTYTNGSKSTVIVSESGSAHADIYFSNTQGIDGILIDSHRPNPVYAQLNQIPLQPMTASQSFSNYNAEMQQRYSGGYTGTSPVFRMKESLISMGVFGEGNRTLGGSNEGLWDTFTSFNAVLRKLLPESLGFREIAIRAPEVVLITDSGDFMLDASSGGIMAVLDIAWRIHMFSRDKSRFVVLMDEPENHLHPSMQRTLMRRLIAAFPNAQFVIATHSPFMVSSVKDSSVYVLRYAKQEGKSEISHEVGLAAGRRVSSQVLSRTNKAATAGEILREVLGVPATMPEWVEEELDFIISKYRFSKITSDSLDNLRADLSILGYDEYYSEALGKLTAKQ
ncbi:putative AbiEii toxin of type IV toxin-antitoxin system [Rhizobium sp. PP-CC-2G-626]|nr:putative AbiEii toxin of type IV toxin-antitoxin system [Rhizobium sp. PP-CC-2G-626]